MKRLTILLITIFLLAGCINTVRVGEVQNDEQQIPLGNAERVNVDIRMGAGMLNISGGAEALLDASVWYNVAEWEPQITYDDSGDVGQLDMRQPDINEINWGNDVRYEWNLLFNDDVPMDMHAQLGAGESSFALWTLNLDELRVEAGAGETFIDLHGGRVNDLDVAMGAGQMRIDLSGAWDQDVNGRIRGGVGELIVTLPAETNVEARVEGGLGQVNANGLTRSGDTYSHDAGSEYTITLDIEGGVGQITLELAQLRE